MIIFKINLGQLIWLVPEPLLGQVRFNDFDNKHVDRKLTTFATIISLQVWTMLRFKIVYKKN